MNLAPIPDLKRANDKDDDLIAQIQEVHKATFQNLEDYLAKYKASADKKRHAMEFDKGDYVWVSYERV